MEPTVYRSYLVFGLYMVFETQKFLYGKTENAYQISNVCVLFLLDDPIIGRKVWRLLLTLFSEHAVFYLVRKIFASEAQFSPLFPPTVGTPS